MGNRNELIIHKREINMVNKHKKKMFIRHHKIQIKNLKIPDYKIKINSIE